MSGISQIKIKESIKTLKALLNEQKSSDCFQKIQVLYLLKSQQVKTITEVAMIVGRHRVTVQGWLRVYQNQGIEGLLKEKMVNQGRKSLIPQEIIEKLTEKLQDNCHFYKYKEIQLWLEEELGQTINYDVVYYLVHKKLGFSLKGKKPQNKSLILQSYLFNLIRKKLVITKNKI